MHCLNSLRGWLWKWGFSLAPLDPSMLVSKHPLGFLIWEYLVSPPNSVRGRTKQPKNKNIVLLKTTRSNISNRFFLSMTYKGLQYGREARHSTTEKKFAALTSWVGFCWMLEASSLMMFSLTVAICSSIWKPHPRSAVARTLSIGNFKWLSQRGFPRLSLLSVLTSHLRMLYSSLLSFV